MGKGASAKMQVVDYRLSIHFGVCLGQVDYFRRIRINEKTAWQGHVSTLSAVSVNNAYLFGGPQKEGGIKGTLHFLPGASDQLLPAALASKYGKTPETVVAYRGISTIYFTGESAGQGFMWGSNNPIVAQTVDVDATRMATGLDPALAQIGNPEFPEGPDTNPAHIIFEAMTDPDDGSVLPEDMGYASFNAAAQTLVDEAFGMSLLWTKPMKVEDFVNEIQGHINAVTYVDPETGLMDIKLIRDDYNPLELFEINADNAKLVDFERRMLGETTNEIVVSYTNPRNEEETSITVQDLATAQTQGPISDTRNFYGIRRSDLAEQVGWRELRTVNAPLATVNVLMNREGWNLRPGQPVRVYFPDDTNPDRTIDIIARVGEIEYGEPGSEDIPIALTEDVFSLSRPVSRRGESSGWVDPSDPPTPMVAQQVFTLPTYMVLSANYQDRVVDLTYPEVLAGVLGHHNSYDALSFDLVDSEVQPTGELELTSAGTKTLTERGSLLQSLAPEPSSEVLLGTLPLGRGPRIGGFVLVGTAETGQEIMLITGYDGFQYTVDRGVLDTIPRSWSNGTPAWYINPNSRFIDDRTVRSAGEDVSYYLLPRTSLGQLDIDDATPVSGVLTARPHLPLRPANVMANGVPISGAVNVSTADDIVLTWATRNRLLEDGQVVAWDAAPVAPEYKQRTIVLVSDTAGNEIRRYVHLWTENTFTLPKAWFARWAEVRVYVFAEREELTSLQAMRFDVTGLANDAGAALPPPAPEAGTPPPPVAAPEVGRFTVTGGHMQDANGVAQIPALFVMGRRSNPNATGLIVRYAVAAGAPDYDWQYWPAASLDERDLYLPIDAVAPNTSYRVEVAYVEGGVVGYYLFLGNALTGALVSDNTAAVGPIPAETLVDRLESVEVISAANAAAVADLDGRVDDTITAAEAAIAAGEAADLAVLKAGEAGSAASSANISAGIATTKATEAGNSAEAADAARLTAEAARDDSQQAASASVISASNAAASAGAAGDYAEASEGSATQAATAAGSALTYRDQASSARDGAVSASASAGVSASTASAAKAAILPPRLDSDGSNFTVAANGSAETATPLATTENVSGFGLVGTTTTAGAGLYNRGVMAFKAGRIYRVRARVEVVGGGSHNVRIYVRGQDGAYATTDNQTSAWVSTTAGTPVEVTLLYGNPAPAGGATLGGNTSWVRAGVQAQTLPSGGRLRVYEIYHEDITESANAAASAASAVTQAASASASASAASISANLAARAGLLPNMLPNSTAAVDLSGWIAGAWTRGFYAPIGPFFYCTAAGDQFALSPLIGAQTGLGYTISFQADTGGATAAVYVAAYNADGTVLIQDGLGFHAFNSTNWLTRRTCPTFTLPAGASAYRVVLQKTAAASYAGIARIMANLGDAANWNDDATARTVQAQLSVTASVAADAQTRLSSARFEVIAAAGSDPAQLLIRADTSGSLAALVASAIRFSNVVNGTIIEVMRLVNGNVFITGKLYIGGSPGSGVGYILLDGPNMRIDMYDESNVLKMRIGKLS